MEPNCEWCAISQKEKHYETRDVICSSDMETPARVSGRRNSTLEHGGKLAYRHLALEWVGEEHLEVKPEINMEMADEPWTKILGYHHAGTEAPSQTLKGKISRKICQSVSVLQHGYWLWDTIKAESPGRGWFMAQVGKDEGC